MLLAGYLFVLIGLCTAFVIQRDDFDTTWYPSNPITDWVTTSTNPPGRSTSSPPNYPTTSTPYTNNSSGPSCGTCDPQYVWNDVFYLVDSSLASDQKNVGDMWAFILTLSQSFNVQRSSYSDTQQYMRAGVLVYSDDVRIVGNLGDLSFDDMLGIDLPYLGGGERGTNLEKAIQVASEQFDGPGHRNNARKVIFVIAPDYNPAGSTAPQKVASTFKSDGGIIMTYEYTPSVGAPNPGLQELSTPGYSLNNHANTFDDVYQAQCDANCFCLKNYQSFGNSNRNTPSAGCYYAVDLPSSLLIGNRNCLREYNGGYIASAQTREKQDFLTALTNSSTYIIGLTYKSGSYVWMDGTPLGDYRPFRSGYPGASDAVIVLNNQWDLTNSRNGYWYVCESGPCSSNKYCDGQ